MINAKVKALAGLIEREKITLDQIRDEAYRLAVIKILEQADLH